MVPTSIIENSMPSDWMEIKLGDYIILETGKRLKGGALDEGEVPSLGGQHINENGRINREDMKYITEEFFDEMKQGKVQKNDVLVVKDGATTGKTAIVRELISNKVAINEHVFIVRSKINTILDNYYIYFYFKSTRGHNALRRNFHGLIGGIKRDDVKSLKFFLPKIDEQRKIINILNTIENDIFKTDKVIFELNEFKKSLLHHLFTYGPVPVDQRDAVELQETEIGLLPKEWVVKKLGEIASMKSGGTPSRKNTKYWNGDIPWVKTGEINYKIILDTEEKITDEGLENSSARMIPKGTLLIAMYGQGITRGRVAILGIDASINQACGAIFPSKEILTEYLFFYLSYIYHEIRSMGHGANQRNLNSNIVKSLNIPIQSLAQQKTIVETLRIVDKEIDAEINKKSALEELFRTLLEKLMTGQTRVNELNLEEIQT